MFSGTFTASGIMIGADRELMDQWLWLLIAIGAAAIFVVVILLRRKKERTKEDNALLTLGLTLVVLGIIFGDDPLIGYSFIGVGVLLSIISAIKSRSKRMKQRSAN
jgi:drug/metabolite transporter (DMT)-like permease